MSIELGDEKNLKTKTMDQKEEKFVITRSSNSTIFITACVIFIIINNTSQPEVFDSSGDNAISEMKEVADMGQMRWLRFSCMWKKTAGWILYLQVSMIALKIPILKVDPIQILIQLPFLQWWIRSYKKEILAQGN